MLHTRERHKYAVAYHYTQEVKELSLCDQPPRRRQGTLQGSRAAVGSAGELVGFRASPASSSLLDTRQQL